jgi:hypothetical protein
MKADKYILILLLLSSFDTNAQNYYHLFLPPVASGSVQETVSTDVMTKRIKDDAVAYSKYAPVPRLAEIDMAFGVNLTEFNKMAGYGVLYIPSLNQDSSEYPIKRVYLKSANELTELKEIGEIKISVKDEQILHTFGKNRVDYYYLIPYSLIQKPCELLIDWNSNRKEFLLSKFPNGDTLDYIKNIPPPGDPKTINRSVLKEFLEREYQINIE